MRKFLIAFATIALVAVFLFAFAACNDTYTPTVKQGWSAETEMLRGMITSTINFVSDTHWRVDIGGKMASWSENDNWCRGEYWFEGAVGESPLHMSLNGPEGYYFDEFGADEQNNNNDPKYDPSSVRIIDADGNAVDYDEEMIFYPDEAGVYTIRLTLYGFMDKLLNSGGTAEDGYMVFAFYPPQDGTLGSNGDMAPVQPGSGPDLFAIIIAVPIVVVVLIVGIVVTVVLVKKNKKKKAAAAAAENGEGDISPDDGSEA